MLRNRMMITIGQPLEEAYALSSLIYEGVMDQFPKLKIMVVKDIERDDIEFVCKAIGCKPVASLDHFLPDALGSAELVEESQTGDGRLIKITGVPNAGKAVGILIRGSNKLMLDESQR